jgi:hypothetical protein
MPHSRMASDYGVTHETAERRKRIEREDRAFVVQLRAAILCGLETPAGVPGHQASRPCVAPAQGGSPPRRLSVG